MTSRVKSMLGRNLMLVLLPIVACLLFGFVFVIVSVPTLPKGANDAAAASSLRLIYFANVAYAKNHPGEGYARRLSDLSENDRFWTIGASLASGKRQGYGFTYSSQSTKGNGKLDTYQALADPLVPDKTGRYHFFVNETGVIRMSDRGQANAASDPIQ